MIETKSIARLSLASVVACMVASPLINCSAALADSVEQTSSSTSTSETVEVKKGVKFKFRERLHDLHTQIDTAQSKGWIGADKATAFNSRADQLVRDTSSAEADGWPEAKVDRLEKAITKLNADLSTASTASGKSVKVN